MRILPRHTVRLRLTALYGVLFLGSGAVLLAISSGVVAARSTTVAVPAQGQQAPQTALTADQALIRQLRHQLAQQTQSHSSLSQNLLIAAAIALGVMTVVAIAAGWIIAGRALRPLRAMTTATRADLRGQPARTAAMRGPRRRAQGSRRHHRRAAGPAGGGVRRAAPVRRQRLARAAHPADHDARVGGRGRRQARAGAAADGRPGRRLHTELDRVDRLLDGLLALARAQHGDLPGRPTLVARTSSSARPGRAGGRHRRRH